MTSLTVRLVEIEPDFLISRSQARRVCARFEQFAEVLLDFTAVDFIGQAFADEIFRVFQLDHPGVKLHVTGANAAVTSMIRRAQTAASAQT